MTSLRECQWPVGGPRLWPLQNLRCLLQSANSSRVCRRRGCSGDEVFELLALAGVSNRSACLNRFTMKIVAASRSRNRPVSLARCTFQWQLKSERRRVTVRLTRGPFQER